MSRVDLPWIRYLIKVDHRLYNQTPFILQSPPLDTNSSRLASHSILLLVNRRRATGIWHENYESFVMDAIAVLDGDVCGGAGTVKNGAAGTEVAIAWCIGCDQG